MIRRSIFLLLFLVICKQSLSKIYFARNIRCLLFIVHHDQLKCLNNIKILWIYINMFKIGRIAIEQTIRYLFLALFCLWIGLFLLADLKISNWKWRDVSSMRFVARAKWKFYFWNERGLITELWKFIKLKAFKGCFFCVCL